MLDQSTLLQLLLVVVLSMISGLYAGTNWRLLMATVGLTIGLMSLDETTLQVVRNTGDEKQRRYAERIAPIRKDGYMLLIINETIPIVAEGFFNTGWAAVMLSTILLLVFGEILPQAICTRYGLLIGGHFAWLVRITMMLMYPIAYPTARLLEWMLGRAHGVVYKRAELKELVSIMGGKIELGPDEVKIIRGVLELKDKHPALIMTPMDKVYMLDAEGVLDKLLVEEIVGRGYSRVPVYYGSRDNVVGVLLVKRLLSLNLTDSIPISSLPISPIPKVSIKMSLFSILNEFKKGQSHIAIVVLEKQQQIGILTLEDIIEELIQEEIVDESDLQSSWRLGPTPPTILDLLASSHRRVVT